MLELICPSCGKAPGASVAGQSLPPRCDSCGALLTIKPGSTKPSVLESFGKYTLDREIGRGNMGIVYDAHDTTLNRRVALKIMHSHRTENPKEAVNGWQRFLQEARLTANLAKHPGIVTVYEAEVREGKRYIAMEFLAGEPMNRWRREETVTLRDQVRLLRDVSLAVHHAHEQGIIHRDLKPGNVLVTQGNKPVVTDFGLATWERRHEGDSLTPSGYIVGSPGYMSPEQARGHKHIDRTADVYSLGVMLYEILAGRPPFEGKTPVDILSRVVDGVKTSPSQTGPDAVKDEVLEGICLKAMALRAHDRYSTAQKFAEQLSRWLGEGTPGARISPLRIAITVTVTVLVCAAVFLLWQNQVTSAAVLKHLERGAEMMKTGKFASALGSYEQALALDPSNEEAQRGRDGAHTLMEAKPFPTQVLKLDSFKQIGKALYNSISATEIEYKSPGTMETTVGIPDSGEYEVTVAASCQAAKGENARFRLHSDGKPLPEVALRAESAADYKVTIPLVLGERRLAIEFTNDYYDEKTLEDRNLKVHGVSIRRVK